MGRARRAPDMPLFAPDTPDAPSIGRRATEPLMTTVPRVSFKVRTFLDALLLKLNLILIHSFTWTTYRRNPLSSEGFSLVLTLSISSMRRRRRRRHQSPTLTALTFPVKHPYHSTSPKIGFHGYFPLIQHIPRSSCQSPTPLPSICLFTGCTLDTRTI